MFDKKVDMKTQKNNLIVIVMVFLIAAYLGLDFKQKQNTTNGSALPPSTNLVIDDQQKKRWICLINTYERQCLQSNKWMNRERPNGHDL